MFVLLILAGLILLVVGAEMLVRGASRLAGAVGLSPLIIGLTVVAYGTSAPEVAVSLKAAWIGQADIALGNVVGSNILNVLLILGLSATIVPLAASWQLVRLDVPILIGASAMAWWFAADGTVSRLEGMLLALGIGAYTAFLLVLGRRQASDPAHAEAAASWPGTPTPSRADADRPRLLLSGLLVLVGLALLVLGARWLVQGAVDLARIFGVSELLIGLTIVAAGTSAPEVATSIIAAIRGQRDIAVGNIVGSNIFNLLGVLGPAALISPVGVAVAPDARSFDLPIMMAVAVVCLPVFFTGGRISRLEGLLLLGYYVAYIVFLVLQATQHPQAAGFGHAMLYFVIPLSGLAIALSVYYAVRQKQRAAGIEPPREGNG